MNMIKRINNWLESHASAPTYSGWVLLGLSVCFFGAAINTMAGWLYVISGVSFALLGIAAFLPPRSLVGLSVHRRPIQPVSVGDELTVELAITNHTKQPATLLQVEDMLSFVLMFPEITLRRVMQGKIKGVHVALPKSLHKAIETIPPQETYHWVYNYTPTRRGVYRWHKVELATGAPLGLFWCRRPRQVPATAIVYPTVLPLTSCPLVDEMGQENSLRGDPRGRPFQTATEGLTRSLRPYRIGDPTRLIHWRTSARYGELRVRELEMVIGGQEIIIALDTAGTWEEENFEQAVIAAASLYFYTHRQQMNVKLWTALTGLVQSDRVVLETLAATNPGEDATVRPPSYPLIWLTQNPLSVSSLPSGSRWILWQSLSSPPSEMLVNRNYPGIMLQSDQPLQLQLQKPLR